MRTQVFYYAFDSDTEPGKLIAHGVRFETVTIPNNVADKETLFPVLCQHQPTLKAVPIDAFKLAVNSNFPDR